MPPMLLALLLAAQTVPPPETVNDQVLGMAEDFKVTGPARICIGSTTVDLQADETGYLAYAGIHWGGIRVIGPRGTHVIKEGDAWRPPKKPGKPIRSVQGRTIERHRAGDQAAFLLYSRTAFSAEEEVPVIWIDREDSGRVDSSLFTRVTYSVEPIKGCSRHFDYGWDFLLPEGNEEEEE